jgi:hypothetical protein
MKKIMLIIVLLGLAPLALALDDTVKGEYIIIIRNKTNIDGVKKYLSAYGVSELKRIGENIYLIKSGQSYKNIKNYALKYKGIKGIEPNRTVRLIEPVKNNRLSLPAKVR